MSFIDYFGEITDPRKDINVKHNLLDVIFLTITAVISGCEGWKDIYDFGRVKLCWLRQYREFKNGIPVDDTIARILSALVPEEFTKCFIDWVNELRRFEGKEQKAFMADLKLVYKATSKEMAQHHLLELNEKWGKKYPAIMVK
jgi:predicted transposase YbfD/YdcC